MKTDGSMPLPNSCHFIIIRKNTFQTAHFWKWRHFSETARLSLHLESLLFTSPILCCRSVMRTSEKDCTAWRRNYSLLENSSAAYNTSPGKADVFCGDQATLSFGLHVSACLHVLLLPSHTSLCAVTLNFLYHARHLNLRNRSCRFL